MTHLKRKNGDLFPSLSNDVFGSRLFSPSVFDADNDFWDTGFKTPFANISETDKEFKVELSAPGLKKEDFKVEVENGALVISCEKEEEKKDEKENYKRREFSYNSFYRSFELPENITEDKINAKYDNGMLRVTIPKKDVGVSKSKKAIQVA